MDIAVFSKRLKTLMTEGAEEAISKRRLANEAGVSRTSVKQWLDGSFYPRYDGLIKLSDYFSVSLEYLVERSDHYYEEYASVIPLSEVPLHFKQCVRIRLCEKGIKAYRLSRMLKIEQSTISKWLKSETMPETPLLVQVADALDCTLDFLLGREKREPAASGGTENRI